MLINHLRCIPFCCALLVGLATMAEANLLLLQASGAPNPVTIPTNRASTISLTFRSDREITLDGGKFCTAIHGSVPTCAAADVIQNAQQTSLPASKVLRVRLFVPASVAARAKGGSIYFVQALASMSAGTTRVPIRLDGGAYSSSATQVETGRLSVESARIVLQDQGRRVFDDIDTQALAKGTGRITAELRTSGIGLIAGWWVVDTPNGRTRLSRFTARGRAAQPQTLLGPSVADLPQTLFGPHSISLMLDPGVVVSGAIVPLTYSVKPSLRKGTAHAWVRDGRLYWRIQDAPNAYAVLIEGSKMRWPILSAISGSGRPLPLGAQRVRVLDKQGIDIAPPVSLDLR